MVVKVSVTIVSISRVPQPRTFGFLNSVDPCGLKSNYYVLIFLKMAYGERRTNVVICDGVTCYEDAYRPKVPVPPPFFLNHPCLSASYKAYSE